MERVKGGWADTYRKKWSWDSVVWGSHSVDCYPGGCPFRVYVKDGKVVREEQGGTFSQIEAGIPDMNPMGCQKGACWSHQLYGPDRVTQPLKRVGERGEGKFEPVSWDEALTDIADAMLDAIEEQGSEAILTLMTPEVAASGARIFADLLGTPVTDGNAEFQDFSPGWHLTWGLFNPASTMDDWFLAELTLIWHANPVYTNIHWYHYVAESRYNGGEVATIAPDYSPSAIHADYHLPVRIGTDAALALSMCKVIIDAGIYNRHFVQEQTDLPLLVRKDTDRFLRGSDVSEGDRDDQFFWLDSRSRTVVAAPRGTLASGNLDPALEGSAKITLRDGSQVEVEPVFERLKRLLIDYEPEKASRICGIHPDVIRKLARKVATRKTKIFIGWNSGKYYHGDLMERSMALLLGLTGNWGKKGTGTRSWAIGGWDGFVLLFNKGRLGPEAAREQLQNLIPDAASPHPAGSAHDHRDGRERGVGDEPGARRDGAHDAPRLRLVLPVRLQGALEQSGQPRSLDEAQLRRVPERGHRQGLVPRELCEGLSAGRASRALRIGRQYAPAPARRSEPAARAPLAEAKDDRIGRLPDQYHGAPLGLHPARRAALREAGPEHAERPSPQLGALRPRRRSAG